MAKLSDSHVLIDHPGRMRVDTKYEEHLVRTRGGLQESVGNDGYLRDQVVILQQAVEGLLVRGRGVAGWDFPDVLGHTKPVEEGLEAVVDVAGLRDNRSRCLGSKERDLEVANKMNGLRHQRREYEGPNWRQDRELAWPWRAVQEHLEIIQGRLVPEHTQLPMELPSQLLLVPDPTVGLERAAVRQSELHRPSDVPNARAQRPEGEQREPPVRSTVTFVGSQQHTP